MAITFKKITSISASAGATSMLEISNIPATYDDLILYLSVRLTIADNSMSFTLNGNTGAVNNSRRLNAAGTTVDTASRSNSSTYDSLVSNASSWTAGIFSNKVMYFPNYRSSDVKTSCHDGVAENNGVSANIQMGSILISDNNPITSLKVFYTGTSNDIAQYSSATLYGIKRA